MRLLVYNIAYGTGCPGGEAKRLLTAHRYLRTGDFHFDQIVGLVDDVQPDMIGLVEADSGSWRTSGKSHPDTVERLLNGLRAPSPATGSKYGPRSLLSRVPYLKSQTNALLTRTESEVKRHYFPCGTKKLILERASGEITVYLVHLGLTRRVRTLQLDYLRELLPRDDRPFVLAGDFNTFRGERDELTGFMADLRLRNANESGAATYPAWKPLRQLDYILVSRQVRVESFEILPVLYSDHLPLVADLAPA